MTFKGEVLIAILNNLADMEIVRQQGWYRIPLEKAEKLRQQPCWPPKWLAFYQTRVFGEEAYKVVYYARVVSIAEMHRWELFPQEPKNDKSDRRYLKVELSTLERLASPIQSDRLRRVTFIPTTWERLMSATDLRNLSR